MSSSLATLVYALGMLGLFYLNHDKSAQTSKALWIPVIWFWILGSRAVSLWLNGGWGAPTGDQLMEGSPTDALVFQLLIASALVVLFRRSQRSSSTIAANLPIVFYFSYCLISVVWSDFPDVSLKRWIKATGDVVMPLVIVTDAQPIAALRRLFSRVGFLLLPASLLLIKYYPYLGRTYNRWTGEQSVTGVTTDKNLLGLCTYVLGLGALWQVIRLWRESSLTNRFRQLLAQSILLGLAIYILSTANSATSFSCFTLASFVMLVTSWRRIRGRPGAVHATVLTLAVLGVLVEITGVHAAIVQMLGRKPDLTGRASEIWPMLFDMAPNFLLGAGFETFWLGPRLQKVWAAIPNLFVSEAHNGYLELYLNVGVIGIILVISILIHGYRRAVAASRIDPGLSSLALAYVLSVPLYGYTEAGFRMLELSWSFLLLAIIAASRLPAIRAQLTPGLGNYKTLQPDSTISDFESVQREPLSLGREWQFPRP